MVIKIVSYQFGRMNIDGREYSSDLIIFPGRVEENWWRKEGHKLLKEDLAEIVKARPKVLIVGTGYAGLMKIPKETEDFLRLQGIELIAEPTKKAVEHYNELSRTKRVVAAFHLTC